LKTAAVRISFFPQMDTDTTHGTVAQQQAAYRYACAKVAASITTRSNVIFVWAPSGGSAANGKATTCLPGLTAADFVDEIGVQYPVPSTGYTTFAADIAPWKTWLTANAPTRKFIPVKAAVHVDAADSTHQGNYVAGIVTELQANPTLYSGFVWDALPTGALDDRNPAKTNNSLLWQAFQTAVANAAAAPAPPVDTTPPPTPTGLSATAQTTTTCTLSWQQQTVPDWASTNIIVDGAVAATVTAPTMTYTVTGLTASSLHNYGVQSVDTSGNLSLINALTGVTQPGTGNLLPPTISATVAMTGLTGAASATVTDPAGGITVVTWNWGDGTTDVGLTQSHTWAPGNYTVTATVLSTASGLSTVQTINVAAVAPVVTPTLQLAELVPGQPISSYTRIINGNSLILDAAVTSFTPTTTKTAAYTASAGDLIPVDVSGGNVTVTLPTSAADKSQIVAYLKAFTAGNALTIAAAAADLIESATGTATTATRSAGAGESIALQYDAPNGLWRQLADRIPISLLGRARVVVAQAYAATITPAVTTNVDQILNVAALTGALTLGAPTGTPADAQLLKVRFVQDGTGGRVITFNAAYAFGTDITTALVPTTANAKWEMVFEWNVTDSKWRAVAIARGF
jgi:chitodextrinase